MSFKLSFDSNQNLMWVNAEQQNGVNVDVKWNESIYKESLLAIFLSLMC